MPSDDAELLASLNALVQAGGGELPTVEAILEHTSDVVPEAQHVSLTVRDRRGGFTTLAATSPTAERADELQYELEEGPCIEALVDTDWYRSGDVASDSRWPRWGPAAAALGAVSLCSVPLLTRDERVGALTMYSEKSGAFGEREVIDLASLYAVHVSYALAAARQLEGLEAAMQSRHTIGLAQGMLIARFGLDPASSFALLRRVSSTQNRKLRDIARELVDTGDIAGAGLAERPPTR